MTELSPTTSPSQALSLIAEDMRGVDALIAQRLSTSVALVGDVSQYIIAAGGKRLRPQLLLLCCGALGYTGTHRLTMAAVVEFIHTATLLHDDVVDESTLRRGLPTANARFGNPASVLIGDFLYSRAFQMMVQVQEMRIMQVLADATNVIAEGEVMQLMNMHNADLSEADYLQVIRSKTSKLFEASAQVAAILAKASPAVETACATFGQALGTAFQVIDDVLDYAGDASVLGKNLGDDLREGKCTLPLITAMQLAPPEDAATIRDAIEKGDVDALEAVASIVKRTGALDAAMHSAQSEISRALHASKHLPAGPYVDCMVQLAQQSLVRSN
jgi:octaprenyl-diphosphate synthase